MKLFFPSSRGMASGFVSAALAVALVLALPGCDSVESLERDAKSYLAKGDQNSASIQFQALLAMDPNHADAYFELGRIFANVSRFPEAETNLRRALEFGKPAADVMPVLGRVLVELEKNKELLELLEPSPARPQPTDPRGLAEYAVLRGYALMGERDITGANTQFQLAMNALPERAKLGLARVAMARNDRAQAQKTIAEILASNPLDTEARLAGAELRRTAGETEQGLREYAEAVKNDPGNINAQLQQAIALILADKVAEAQPILENAKKVAPVGPLNYFAQALIDCKGKQYQACGDNLDRVLTILPRYMPAVLLAGHMNYALGNYELAQNAFLRQLEKYPGDLNTHKLLAATLLAKTNPQGALNVLGLMFAKGSEDPQALGLAGQALLQLGDLQRAQEALLLAVKLAPADPDFRAALALTRLAGGMRRQAEADFREAIKLKPANARPDYGLIMMLLGEGRIDAAREAVAALEKRLPADPETPMLKGVVLRQAGDLPGARLAFGQAAKLSPDFFPAVEELADMDLAEGKPDAARDRIQEVLRKNPTQLDAMLAMAKLELRMGRRPEGLAWARRAVDAHPVSQDALLLVAEVLAQSGELDEAIGSVQAALKVRQRSPRALKMLGQLYVDKKDYTAAITTYTTLVTAQPASMEAALLLASAYMASGDVTTAVAAARGALKRNPNSVEARALLGDILLQGKKFSDAIEFAHKLQRDFPKLAYGHWLEGQALLAQGDAQRAVKSFETAVKLEPTGRMLASLHHATAVASPGSERENRLQEWVSKNPGDAETRMYLANALSAKRRYKEAMEQYQELVTQDPKNPQALNNLAWALQELNDPRALEYAERAFQLRPDVAPVLDTYGWVLVTHGKLYEGTQLLLKAVAKDDKNPEIRYHLAKALLQAGDKARARAELKTLLAAGKPFPHLDEARAMLAKLEP